MLRPRELHHRQWVLLATCGYRADLSLLCSQEWVYRVRKSRTPHTVI